MNLKKYTVIKPFQDITGFKAVGEFIELEDGRAAKLRARGLVGGLYKDEAKTELTTEEIAELKEIYPESKEIEKKAAAKKVR